MAGLPPSRGQEVAKKTLGVSALRVTWPTALPGALSGWNLGCPLQEGIRTLTNFPTLLPLPSFGSRHTAGIQCRDGQTPGRWCGIPSEEALGQCGEVRAPRARAAPERGGQQTPQDAVSPSLSCRMLQSGKASWGSDARGVECPPVCRRELKRAASSGFGAKALPRLPAGHGFTSPLAQFPKEEAEDPTGKGTEELRPLDEEKPHRNKVRV